MNELDDKTAKLLSNIIVLRAKVALGIPLPNYLTLEINKLMCDYNEALKNEKDGK